MSLYPEGWTHEDLFNKPLDDILALPDDQRTTLFDGLKATFGEDGFNEIKQEINRRHWARREAAEESKQESVQELLAPFIRNLNSVFQTETTEDWGNWGFVVFRTTPYGGEHETQWAEFRRRWDALIEEGLAPYRGTLPKVDKAISLLQFQWVEQPELEGASAAEVARRFREMDVQMGLDNSACLMVTPASMDSVLSASLPLSTPRRERRTIPFVVAVDREAIPLHLLGTNDEDIAGADFKGYFNVAVSLC